MRRPRRGAFFVAELWLRQRRQRWRTRRERREERIGRSRRDRPIDRRPVWRTRRLTRWTIIAAAGVLVGWTVYAAVLAVLATEPDQAPFSRWCAGDQPRAYYCGQVQDFVKGPLVIALGLAIFLLWRFLWVNRWYHRHARADRRMLVPTAEDAISGLRVVGREELCDLIIERLRDRTDRRPFLLVGGIGTGKTATLVRLAEKLTAADAVPVGVELRTVTEPSGLDFHRLAQEQFRQTIDAELHAEGEGDKVWRRLWLENRVVVLADGLDETLADANQPVDRDSVLREAVREAVRQRLALVIASRPDDPLRGLDALMLQLEPLSVGAALDYVRTEGRQLGGDVRWGRITDLIKHADVADSPFYLRVIGHLHAVDRLTGIEPPYRDRPSVRWRLLQEWYDALVAGDLHEDYGLPSVERGDALEVLSALACVGLRENRQRVRTRDLTEPDGASPGRRFILAELRNRLRKLHADDAQDLGLAQTTGAALDIVRKQQDGVRFQHGVVQAYLGARFLTAALRDENYLEHALTHHRGPGRELLTALTLYTRSGGVFERLDGRRRPGRGDPRRLAELARLALTDDPAGRDDAVTRRRGKRLVDRLLRAALTTDNRTRAVEIFAAALEMDAAVGHPSHARLARAIHRAWPRYQGDGSVNDRPLEDAKIALVHRFGAAARLVRERPSAVGLRRSPAPRYRRLFDLLGGEMSYLPRLNGAREIAAGGNAAIRELRHLLDPPPADAGGPARATRERTRQLRAWLAAPLFLFCDDEHRDDEPKWRDVAQANLRRWVDRLAAQAPDGVLEYELTLAQGFRLAANCRHYPEHRSALAEEAERALRHSRFWYSHLVLVQALTLLALPRHPGEPLRRQGHGSDPRGLVDYWVRIAGSGDHAPGPGSGSFHPLVREAADLCVAALIDRHPERHLWSDERETVSRVGSASPDPDIRGQEDSWLPPSHGWGVLEARPQRLLADVMLLLNLADRGRDDVERSRRLTRANRPELPPCLTIDRRPMRVDLSQRQAGQVDPGSTCVDDCPFRLCPLPARGEELPYQMDEAFCARQIDLVGTWYRAPGQASWRAVDRVQLRDFWRQMAERMVPAWRK